MRPTLHIRLPSGTPDIRWVLSGPMQGFDAVRIVTQIASVQCLHYLTLALVLPPLLSLLAFDRSALNFQGGPASLSILLDWREIAGWPVLNGGRPWPWSAAEKKLTSREQDKLGKYGLGTSAIDDGKGIRYWWEWEAFLQQDTRHFIKIKDGHTIAWEGQKLGANSLQDKASQAKSRGLGKDGSYRDYGWWYALAQDRSRGWVIVLAWAVAGAVDVYLLSMLIRRPTHILDHAITLQALHLALTWAYTRSFPTSLFYWLVMAAHTGACVVWAEALSIRREMRIGFQSGFDEEGVGSNDSGATTADSRGRNDEGRALLGGQARASSEAAIGRGSMAERPPTHVLFEGDDDEDDDTHDALKQANGKRDAKRNGQPHERIEMKRMD